MRPSFLWLSSLAVAHGGDAWDPLSLGVDLSCSACELFIETYLSKCSHYIYGAGRREVEGGKSVSSVYKERIFELYEEHEPSMTRGKKKKKVDKIIDREVKKGLFPARRIHELYTLLCKKYELTPEPIYEGEIATGTEEQKKEKLVLAALNATLYMAKDKSTQWAVSGTEPNRKFIDFNKAMEGGTTDSISTGGDTSEKVLNAFTHYTETYNESLVGQVVNATRVYDSKLDKVFCIVRKVCKPPKLPDLEEDAEPKEEEPEVVDHDEL